ncbi:HDOD domain-containing protein [Maricurvus nonylphenolicus]|uniref:HDOD domain-containing protein n=1 Tax=Maricurvus nonylphenolicus TaxID=1008307 RepID=UPI0036F23D8B
MKLESLFEQSHRMPSIPKVVQELIDSFSDENVDLDTIGSKVAMDQVITAKVLRLANSARFGLPRQVTSANDAVVLLGFNALRTLVLASGVTGAFEDTEGLKKAEFWSNSFSVATIAKMIAQKSTVELNPETAFTCGMLHNVGELLLHVVAPEEMQMVTKAIAAGGARQATQRSILAIDYTEVGAELARLWRFPEEIQEAIAQQIDPLSEDEVSSLACVVNLALYTSRRLNAQEGDYQEPIPEDLVKVLGVDIEALLADEEAIREAASTFDSLVS